MSYDTTMDSRIAGPYSGWTYSRLREVFNMDVGFWGPYWLPGSLCEFLPAFLWAYRITVLLVGVSYIRPVRETINGAVSPVTSNYEVQYASKSELQPCLCHPTRTPNHLKETHTPFKGALQGLLSPMSLQVGSNLGHLPDRACGWLPYPANLRAAAAWKERAAYSERGC